MTLVSVSLVRDECDIIEMFVRINARLFDHMIIVDNGSVNGTLQILESLRKEGISVSLWECPHLPFEQEMITTLAIREIRKTQSFDWLFALDADEFITVDRAILENELKSVPPGTCAALKWRSYVPLSCQYHEFANPLYVLFRPLFAEKRRYGKVAVPYALGNSTLGPGNHWLIDEVSRSRLPEQVLSTALCHVPVRSPEQIMGKSIVGAYKMALKEKRGNGEGFHWDLIANAIRQWGYEVPDRSLRALAAGYGLLPGESVATVNVDGPRIGRETDHIVYRDRSKAKLIQRLDGLIQTICQELINERPTSTAKLKSSNPT